MIENIKDINESYTGFHHTCIVVGNLPTQDTDLRNPVYILIKNMIIVSIEVAFENYLTKRKSIIIVELHRIIVEVF